jgi:hypothetical protein
MPPPPAPATLLIDPDDTDPDVVTERLLLPDATTFLCNSIKSSRALADFIGRPSNGGIGAEMTISPVVVVVDDVIGAPESPSSSLRALVLFVALLRENHNRGGRPRSPADSDAPRGRMTLSDEVLERSSAPVGSASASASL